MIVNKCSKLKGLFPKFFIFSSLNILLIIDKINLKTRIKWRLLMDIRELSINTIRLLSVEQIEKANSGHPGLPLGAAPMAYTLWRDVMKHNPKNPEWFDRDRFILSAGHGSALLYSLFHVFGYGLSREDLMNFRQLSSKTPGHPEYGHTVGVEATTGPLGQGISMAVGMAMAEAHLAETYNEEGLPIIDHYTYALVGDGCLMEGISNEASSLAGSLGLSKLIVLYDSNNISIEGRTDITFTEDVRKRYEALEWDTYLVEDGNDIEAIKKAIEEAKKTDKPSLIEIKTKIGYGSDQEDCASAHGAPIGEESMKNLKAKLKWKFEDQFYVDGAVSDDIKAFQEEANRLEEAHKDLAKAYKEKYPDKYRELMDRLDGKIDLDYLDSDEFYEMEEGKATRASSGQVINKLASRVKGLVGGSADLGPSNKTEMKEIEFFSKENYKGSNIHFGVREHAMAAICNGMALHGGIIPYCATFLIFSDYLKPALRLSALMGQRVIYVLTHDSIGVGEDGPTHQPIEQLLSLRSTPGVTVFRPADGKETAAAWSYALKNSEGPTVLALTRQGTKALEETSKEAEKGGYVVKDFGDDQDLIIMATGSELGIAYEACQALEKEGIGSRLVSMASLEVFDKQEKAYKDSVLDPNIKNRVSIEAGSSLGWYKYVKDGLAIGIDGFGASAPGKELFKEYGFTVEEITKKIKDLVK